MDKAGNMRLKQPVAVFDDKAMFGSGRPMIVPTIMRHNFHLHEHIFRLAAFTPSDAPSTGVAQARANRKRLYSHQESTLLGGRGPKESA
ncbi:hypothetical protein V9T40_007371 [Parthenolecanium corni]|uniref:Uncharacterized protein n=1 Tax=Parthenolecanium corni TaxID=536013 RepID=A0AAN9U4X7_9HEMI